jgi:hypothetical protein
LVSDVIIRSDISKEFRMKRSILAAAVFFAVSTVCAWADPKPAPAPAKATALKVTKVTVKPHDPKNASLGYDIEAAGTMSLDPAAKNITGSSFYYRDADKKDVVVTVFATFPKPGQTAEWKVIQALGPVFPEKGWMLHAMITDDLGVKKTVAEPVPTPPA